MATAYVAGASDLPFAVLRGYTAPTCRSTIRTSAARRLPFTGEMLAAVPRISPDVTVIHAQQADRRATCSLGIVGVQKEAVLAAGGRS